MATRLEKAKASVRRLMRDVLRARSVIESKPNSCAAALARAALVARGRDLEARQRALALAEHGLRPGDSVSYPWCGLRRNGVLLYAERLRTGCVVFVIRPDGATSGKDVIRTSALNAVCKLSVDTENNNI